MPNAYSFYWKLTNKLYNDSNKYTQISSTALDIAGDTIVLYNKYVVSISNGATKNICITLFDTTNLTFTEVFTMDVPQLVDKVYRFDTNYKLGIVVLITDFDMFVINFSDIFK